MSMCIVILYNNIESKLMCLHSPYNLITRDSVRVSFSKGTRFKSKKRLAYLDITIIIVVAINLEYYMDRYKRR